MTNINMVGLTQQLNLEENWSAIVFTISFWLVSIFIIIGLLVFYSRTRHRGLIFILIGELANLGWHILSFLFIYFILPLMSRDIPFYTIAESMNYISLFFRALWGLLFIIGLSKLVHDLAFQLNSQSYSFKQRTGGEA